MIVKIFNTNMIIIIFEDNLVYELNYTNSFSTKKNTFMDGYILVERNMVGLIYVY